MANIHFSSTQEEKIDLKTFKILVVDDDLSIQKMTKIVLSDFEYKNYKLDLITANSAKEAKEILKKTPNIAVILLDVVMESNDAGLLLAQYIREDLQNRIIRIIISTGQAGYAPEKEVIIKYEINGYIEKTQLSSLKLFSIMITAIRSYEDLIHLQESNEKLYKSNIFLKTSQQVAQIGNWEIDFEKNRLIGSDELYTILNIRQKKLDAQHDNILEFIHEDDKRIIEMIYQDSLREKKGYVSEYRIVFEDTLRYVEEHCMHILNEENKIVKSIGTIQDITHRKTVEHKLSKQEELINHQSKMAILGEMLENIAHQWKQPLCIISSSLTTLSIKIELGKLTQELLLSSIDKINLVVEHQAQTIDDFRDFYKVKEEAEFFLDKTITKTLILLDSQFRSCDIKIINKIKKISLVGYENDLIQVLMNILDNARDELINKKNQEKLLFLDLIENKNTIEILIKDNAGGVPLAIKDKIFDSKFTTKTRENGTGIGLYMSQTLVVEHLKGNLEVENVEFIHEKISYLGAQFKITLPKKLPSL
ncbi:MAG: response regulator [Campylobacteraceae bacterium]|nr:response regulator [Campylobacteraceae bacterium]